MPKETIVSLDIGSNKIAGMVAVVNNNSLEIEAAEHIEYEEKVVEKGRVVDIDRCTECIKTVLTELEQQVQQALPFVNISIGGGFLRGWTVFNTLNLETTRRKITDVDIETLLKNIRNETDIPQTSHILDLCPQQYIIDGGTNVRKNPRGMFGSSITAIVHLCVVQDNPLKNIVECVRKAGSEIDKIYPHSWAAAEALLSEEEKEAGVLLIDMGKGTTDFLFYDGGNLYGTYSIMAGGEYVDFDIATLLGISLETAGEIKKAYGWCNYEELVSEDAPEIAQQIELKAVGSGEKMLVSVGQISKIVYDRISDTFEKISQQIQNDVEKRYNIKGFPRLGAGVVLTGGSSLLKGISICGEKVFGKRVRIAGPKNNNLVGIASSYQHPPFSTVVGILLLRAKDIEREPRSQWLKQFTDKKKKISERLKFIWNKW